MKYILIILLANIILTTEGCADNAPKQKAHVPEMVQWTPNEWVLTTVDQSKTPLAVAVFSKKERCIYLAKHKTQKTGVQWTCVGVDPN
jgi:outer membrane biogenesis lipoprotein LolB